MASFLVATRPARVELFPSTPAFVALGREAFELRDGAWTGAGVATFDVEAGRFVGKGAGEIGRLDGFDTFWLNWSNTHPSTRPLGRDGEAATPR